MSRLHDNLEIIINMLDFSTDLRIDIYTYKAFIWLWKNEKFYNINYCNV